MKKTLITLAALAAAFSGVASAGITAGPTYGGNFWISNFDFTFQLTDAQVTALQSGSVLTLAAYWGGNAADTYGANIFTLSYDNGVVLTAGRGSFNTTSNTLGTFQENTTFTGLAAGKTYTLDTTGADTWQTVALYADGTQIGSSQTYKGNMNSSDETPQSYFNTAFEPVTTSPDTPTESVPEPTTATLSLLALAGLAARRRRK